MRRLLLALSLLLFPASVWAVDCASVAGPCNPGPCLASSAASWSCGFVPNTGVDTFSIGASHVVTLDTDLDVLGGNNGALGRIVGSLISDGNRRTFTQRCTGASTKYLRIEGSAGVLNLKGGDRMVARSASSTECQITMATNGMSWLNEGTIGSVQSAGSVSNVGTTWTISGITTTGFQAGDMIWWLSGRAYRYPYEITAVTASSVTYQTDLADASSLDLHLTPDEGTLGGAPLSLHTLPTITPQAGDLFRLIAPVKYTYHSVDGGVWVINQQNAVLNAASNIVLDGYSQIASNLGAQLIPLSLQFAATHTGRRSFRFLNLGEYRAQSPYAIKGQGISMENVYCHDALSGSTSTGSCLDFQPCTAGLCGTAYEIKDLFVGGFHGTRNAGLALTACAVSIATNCSNIVFWEPLVHDLANLSTSESDGIQCDDCDNSLIYRPTVYNIHDPDGTGGSGLHIIGDGVGSLVVDPWIVNAGKAIGTTTWTVVNGYISNTRDEGATCTTGALYSLVTNKTNLNTNNFPAVRNCSIEGGILIGNSTQAGVGAYFQDSGATAARTVRNVLVKGYKVWPGFLVVSTNTQDITLEHSTCGGPVSGTAQCIDNDSANAHTVMVRDMAADGCGGAGVASWDMASAVPTTSLINVHHNSTSGTGCGHSATNWDTVTNQASAASLGFTDASASNYNIATTSPLFRSGANPANSARGVRCAYLDTSRFASGLPFDLSWTNVITESCVDPDRDGWLTFPLGTNSPDSCDGVTDLFNAAPTCSNGETAPGKRVFP